MSNQTLYLIQADFHSTKQHLNNLSDSFTEKDTIILLGDAVLQHQHPALQSHLNVYALENDLEILDMTTHDLLSINYDKFAEICLQFNRCISLK